MRLRWAALLVCICSCSLAQNSAEPAPRPDCPWLTEGSAAHALNGEVRLTVTLEDKSHGVCTFSALDKPTSELKILVGGNDLPSCPNGSAAVAGIGTSAYQCAIHTAHQAPQRMICGTVREKTFAVMGGSSSGEYLKQIAEMVAGSLF